MEQKAAVQSQFGKSADNYVKSKGHAKGKDLMKMVEISGVNKDTFLLDIATGGGHVANAFAPLVKKVVALDLTAEMLESARGFIEGNGHQNVEFISGDAEKLPFEANTFDYVACRIAAHHFPNIKQFFAEAYRVLKPNGYFLFVDNVAPELEHLDQFFNTVEKRRDLSHFRAWKKTELITFMENLKFRIDVILRHEKTFHFIDWAERMGLSAKVQAELMDFIKHSSADIKKHFRVIIENEQIISFNAESVIIKAQK